MIEKYNHQITFRADKLPITKIGYVVNSRKEAIMKITRGDNPLNLIVYQNFRLKQLEFQWVINQAKRLDLPPPHELATFRLTAEDKKRKRAEFIKEMFVTEDVRVDGMNRNLIPPPGLCQLKDLSSRNLSQNQIKVNSEIASEMYRSMNYVIEVRADCIAARKTVQGNLDKLG
ncbi:hypothetical protein Tco_0629241 [Tanacetum coccineum]|uniref:Uncharacterized protein n=1 Tax=Tanacetum coccineum TaxID=301880 RepID=A0ABQ4WSM1_9ASTR